MTACCRRLRSRQCRNVGANRSVNLFDLKYQNVLSETLFGQQWITFRKEFDAINCQSFCGDSKMIEILMGLCKPMISKSRRWITLRRNAGLVRDIWAISTWCAQHSVSFISDQIYGYCTWPVMPVWVPVVRKYVCQWTGERMAKMSVQNQRLRPFMVASRFDVSWWANPTSHAHCQINQHWMDFGIDYRNHITHIYLSKLHRNHLQCRIDVHVIEENAAVFMHPSLAFYSIKFHIWKQRIASIIGSRIFHANEMSNCNIIYSYALN